MSSRTDEAFLLDMLLAAKDAREFTAGMSREEFFASKVTHSATLHVLQKLGEAATKVSSIRRNEIAEIPWRHLIGLRHRLVNDYQNINLEIIWDITQNELEGLIQHIEVLVPPPEEL